MVQGPKGQRAKGPKGQRVAGKNKNPFLSQQPVYFVHQIPFLKIRTEYFARKLQGILSDFLCSRIILPNPHNLLLQIAQIVHNRYIMIIRNQEPQEPAIRF